MTGNSVAEIAIDSIRVIKRIRPADSAKVLSLADSIKQLGLMNPISVRPDYQLIAGLHRLEACKKLGWTTIPAIIHDYSATNDGATAELLAELAEIDENLIRNDLTELQQGIQHARRKRIYEALHPETKADGITIKLRNLRRTTCPSQVMPPMLLRLLANQNAAFGGITA